MGLHSRTTASTARFNNLLLLFSFLISGFVMFLSFVRILIILLDLILFWGDIVRAEGSFSGTAGKWDWNTSQQQSIKVKNNNRKESQCHSSYESFSVGLEAFFLFLLHKHDCSFSLHEQK